VGLPEVEELGTLMGLNDGRFDGDALGCADGT
jgi:hypothetical protein